MSHLVKQKSTVAITCLDTLEEALKLVNPALKLNRNKKTARYYGSNSVKCDAAIECQGSNSELALIKNAKGEYEISGDLYDRTLRNAISTEHDKYYGDAACDKVFQGYRTQELVNQALAEGHQVENCVYDPSLNEWALEINAGY